MTTLIILTILFVIVIANLIIISIKKFNNELHNILSKLDSLGDEITDIDDINQKIANSLNEKITSILNKVNKIDSRFITLNEIIKDNLNNIEVAIKGLINSINAIEENNDNIIKSIGEINKFNNNHRRCIEAINNKLIDTGIKGQDILTKLCKLDNIDSKVNAIVTEICSKTESIQIPDGFLDEIAEYISKKLIEIQAKNSLPANKVKKPSPAKSKHRTRAKKADNSHNSVQDTPQQNINEN